MADGGISGDATLLKTFTRLMNVWYRIAVTWIWKNQTDWEYDDTNLTDLPISTTDLVANQQDYSIPTTAQRILRVEVKDVNGDWALLNRTDETDINIAMDEFYSTAGLPKYYRLSANSIFLYPKPAEANVTLTAGLKVYYSRDIDEFASTDTTQEPGFLNNFHRILSLGACLDYSLLRLPQMASNLKVQLNDLRQELIEFYGRRHRDYRPKIKLNVRSPL